MAQDYSDDNSDPEYTKPLHHKRPFGAGIKRKRIDFVPQSTPVPPVHRSPKPSAEDTYLSIVMPSRRSPLPADAAPASPADQTIAATSPSTPAAPAPIDNTTPPEICPACHTHIKTSHSTHAATLTHQLSLPHTHPPSHLDRHRKGLAYLSSYGWDPDQRLGLGARGGGRLFPVRAREKEGKAGIGARGMVEGKLSSKDKLRLGKEGKQEKIEMEKERKEREERMRMLVFGREEVNEFVGVRL